MYYQQDYILRQIEMMASVIMRFLLHKPAELYDLTELNAFTDGRDLPDPLGLLLEEGRVNEAENLLFERLERREPDALETALRFYLCLSRFDERYFEETGYSREELLEGLSDAAALYGLSLPGV